MASIDKTYVTLSQYKEVQAFFTKEMRAKIKEDLGYNFSYYKWQVKDFTDTNSELPIWNTSTLEDLWLAQNCKLSFIQERLHEQWGDKWIGWKKDIDFTAQGFIVSVEKDESFISPYTEYKTGEEVEWVGYDTLVVMGTTYFYDIWNQAIAAVRGERYLINGSLNVIFTIFGHIFEYRDGKYYDVDDNEVYVGYFPNFNIGKDIFAKFFPPVRIVHTWRVKDLANYNDTQIIISGERSVHHLTQFANYDEQYNSRYINQLVPNYLHPYIKFTK